MWRYSYGPVGTGHWWFGFVGFVFWVLVIGGIIVLLVRHYDQHEHQGHHHRPVVPSEPSDPLEIAKARYARGDIDQEEFAQIKKDLAA